MRFDRRRFVRTIRNSFVATIVPFLCFGLFGLEAKSAWLVFLAVFGCRDNEAGSVFPFPQMHESVSCDVSLV